MEKKRSLIQSLDRALDILELVRDSESPIRSSDIAGKVGLGVATAHNIIRSLYQRGYLAQDENSRYLLGPECFKLYKGASDNFDALRRIVSPPVAELAADTGDTTFFGCEYFASLYCVSLSIGGGSLVVNNTQNWLDLLHCTAAGKIIIASKGIEWFARICKRKQPKQLSSRTITTPEAMLMELEKINQQDYALSIGECSEDISALGVAVNDASGKLIGSLAQSFPSIYLDNGKIVPSERAALLRKYAEKISHEYQS
jgi:DNA-binding IclR family transcriptional regulator